MSKVEDLEAQINLLLSLIQNESDKTEKILEIAFRVDLMWKAFIAFCGLVGVSVVGALIALVVGS